MNAASSWTSVSKSLPPPGKSYLVLTNSVGHVADVAYYNGVNSGGVREWLLTGNPLPEITHWAEIVLPET